MAHSTTTGAATILDDVLREQADKLPTFEECFDVYVPHYCEENVWRILNIARGKGRCLDHLFAMFITNSRRHVAIGMQKAAAARRDPTKTCFWDYHVVPIIRIPLRNGSTVTLVYDCDSLLTFPTTLMEYTASSFRASSNEGVGSCSTAPPYVFRVVRFDELVDKFSSDRRHMLRSNDSSCSNWGSYVSRPPQQPCIRARLTSDPHTLPSFLHVDGLLGKDHLSCGAHACRNGEEDIGWLFYDVRSLHAFFPENQLISPSSVNE